MDFWLRGRKYGPYSPQQRTRSPQLPVTDTKEIGICAVWTAHIPIS